MKETRDIRIIKGEDDQYYVEVFYNYETSGKMELDNNLSCYNNITLELAERYIRKLKQQYNIKIVEW